MKSEKVNPIWFVDNFCVTSTEFRISLFIFFNRTGGGAVFGGYLLRLRFPVDRSARFRKILSKSGRFQLQNVNRRIFMGSECARCGMTLSSFGGIYFGMVFRSDLVLNSSSKNISFGLICVANDDTHRIALE